MIEKKGTPKFGEIVIAKVKKINPNSVLVDLLEYDQEGLVHISEVAFGWIKNIRDHVKEGQTVVAKVSRVKKPLSLSIKRVSDNQKNEKLKEFKMEQKAENMLKILAKENDKDFKKIKDTLGKKLLENVGSLYESFLLSMENPKLLKQRKISEKEINMLKKVAEKNIEKKKFELKAELFIKTYKPQGIIIIRKFLEKVKKQGFEVNYISAPKYTIKYTADDKKEVKFFEKKLEEFEKNNEGLEVNANYA